jgi:hypothetical protein
MTSKQFFFDNSESKRVLGIKYHSLKDALKETALSMIEGEKPIVKVSRRS